MCHNDYIVFGYVIWKLSQDKLKKRLEARKADDFGKNLDTRK